MGLIPNISTMSCHIHNRYQYGAVIFNEATVYAIVVTDKIHLLSREYRPHLHRILEPFIYSGLNMKLSNPRHSKDSITNHVTSLHEERRCENANYRNRKCFKVKIFENQTAKDVVKVLHGRHCPEPA